MTLFRRRGTLLLLLSLLAFIAFDLLISFCFTFNMHNIHTLHPLVYVVEPPLYGSRSDYIVHGILNNKWHNTKRIEIELQNRCA